MPEEILPEEVLPVEGCLGDGAEESDFMLSNGELESLPKLFQQDKIIYEYNQKNQSWSTVSCTIFAAIGMLSDLMNYHFTIDEIKEVDELSYSMGRIRGKGWYVKDAVKLVAKRWNNSDKAAKYGKVAYYKVYKYDDGVINELLNKNYTLDTNFHPTVEYSKDYWADAILDGTHFGYETNGHSVDIVSYNGNRSVKDSYKGRKTSDGKKDCNIYTLKNPVYMITNYGQWLYVYTKVKEDNYEELKRLNEFKMSLLKAIDLNSFIWHITNDEKYKEELHNMNESNRKKFDDIMKQIILLS